MSKPPSALTNIKDFLRDQNRLLYNVTADGNCIFRVLAHQLCGSEEHHIELRSCYYKLSRITMIPTLVIGFKICHGGRIVIFDEHLNNLGIPGSWGTQVELQACSDWLKVTIYICSYNPGGIVQWERKAMPKNSINVCQNFLHLLLDAVTLNCLFIGVTITVLYPLGVQCYLQSSWYDTVTL